MTKKRMSLKEMGARARAKAAESDGADTAVAEKPARQGAQVLHSNDRTQRFHTPQSMMLPLPVSKRKVKMDLLELDPELTFASEVNPRHQTLLSLDDPEVLKVERSIRLDQQRDPVIARRVDVDGKVLYEVIAGTTRRFVASHLNNTLAEGWKLRAWVGDIPDGDRRAIAISENRDRRDLSVWEEAIDALKYCDLPENEDKNQETLAVELGVSQSKISKLLKIASIPLSVVELFESPQCMTLDASAALASYLGELSDIKATEAIDALKEKGESFTKVEPLMAALRVMIEPPKQKKPVVVKTKPEIIKAEGKIKAKITAHRQHKGQLKVDLFELSEADQVWLINILQKRFSK